MSGTLGKLEISMTAALWGLEGKTAPTPASSLSDAQDHVPSQLQNGHGRSGVLSYLWVYFPEAHSQLMTHASEIHGL